MTASMGRTRSVDLGTVYFKLLRHACLLAWVRGADQKWRERKKRSIRADGHLQKAIGMCREALRGICKPLDVMTSICALHGSQFPGDPFAKGEARLRDPTVLGS